MVLIKIGCWYRGYQEWDYAKKSMSWPKTNGEINSVINMPGKRGATVRTIVEYSYSINGNTYTGDRIQYGGATRGDTDWYASLMGVPVRSVCVYYDPAAPSTSVLIPGDSRIAIMASQGLVCMVAFGIIPYIAALYIYQCRISKSIWEKTIYKARWFPMEYADVSVKVPKRNEEAILLSMSTDREQSEWYMEWAKISKGLDVHELFEPPREQREARKAIVDYVRDQNILKDEAISNIRKTGKVFWLWSMEDDLWEKIFGFYRNANKYQCIKYMSAVPTPNPSTVHRDYREEVS